MFLILDENILSILAYNKKTNGNQISYRAKFLKEIFLRFSNITNSENTFGF